MKKFKKAMALSLTLAMGLSLVACGDKKDDKTEATTTEAATTAATTEATNTDGGDDATVDMGNGEKIYVYGWNDEVGWLIDKQFKAKYPDVADQVEYVNLQVEGTSDEYLAKVQAAADAGDQYPSIIACDNTLLLAYAAKDFTAPVTNSGFDGAAYSKTAYKYTVDAATTADGLMAVTFQATPGIFLYNEKLANDVLGTADPAAIQEMVKDWDGFFAVAEKMKAAGYYMVSGADDVKYPLLAVQETPWVVDGKLSIFDSAKKMLEYSKKIYDEGYSAKSQQWKPEWYANMANNTTFCFFGTTWFMGDGVFKTDADEDGTYDAIYKSCAGPVGYYWGGTYLLYGKDCKNPALASLVMATLTTDVDCTYSMITMDGDYGHQFVNNTEAVAKAIANGDGALEKLGGQNPYEAFDAGAKMIDLSKCTAYDNQINNLLSTVSGDFNTGAIASLDDAVAELKAQVAQTITDITVE